MEHYYKLKTFKIVDCWARKESKDDSVVIPTQVLLLIWPFYLARKIGDYLIGPYLGGGWYDVYLGKSWVDGTQVGLKILKAMKLGNNTYRMEKRWMEQLKRSLALFKEVRHANIIKLM